MKTKTLAAVCICLLLVCYAAADEPRVLTNHIGYEKDGAKQAVVQGHAGDEITAFKVLEYPGGKEVFRGAAAKAGPVAQWKDWVFWTGDFSPVKNEGTYVVEFA